MCSVTARPEARRPLRVQTVDGAAACRARPPARAPGRPRARAARRTRPSPHRRRTSRRSRRSARWPRAMVSNSAFWNARTVSGSSRSASEVKPVRSANSTVTWRRSASFSGFGAGAGAGAGGGEGGAARALPQRGQNAKAGEGSKPQPLQRMTIASIITPFAVCMSAAGRTFQNRAEPLPTRACARRLGARRSIEAPTAAASRRMPARRNTATAPGASQRSTSPPIKGSVREPRAVLPPTEPR